MQLDGKYITVVILSILVVSVCMFVMGRETAAKMREMQEIAAGPRGDVVFKNKCSGCHKFDATTPGKMNLANLDESWNVERLNSFIQLPPLPMTEWDGSPDELDVLVAYILAGPSTAPAGDGEAGQGE